MKKTRKFMLGLMSIALLTTPVLAGCNGGSSLKYDVVNTGDIQTPEYLVVGDEINLDDYITIDGGAGAKVFDAVVNAISEGVVSIEGHKVKVLREGPVSIGIVVSPDGPDAENPLWRGKFSTQAVSAIKAQYHNATKDISNQFMFFSIEEDERSGDVYAEPMIRHNPEYIWIDRWSQDDKTGEIYSGGIMRCGNGHTHFFDMPGDDIVVDPGHKTDLSYYYVAQDFNLPFTSFDTAVAVDEETGAKQEYLTMDAVNNPIAEEFLSYNCAIGWNEKYCTHSIDVYPITPFDDGEAYWEIDVNVAYAAAPTVSLGVGAALILSTKDEHCKVKAVEDYIANKSEPGALEFGEIPSKFKAIEAAKNYTMTTTTGFYLYDDDTREKTIVAGDDFDSENSMLYNNGVETTTVNETSVVSVLKHGTEKHEYGFYEEGGKVQGYESDGKGGYTTGEAKGTSIWDKNYAYTAAGMGDDSYYTGFRVDARKESATGIEFSIGTDSCIEWCRALFATSVTGSWIVNYVDGLKLTDGGSYWRYVDTIVTVGADYIEYNCEVMLGYLDDEHPNTYVYVTCTTRIDHIGTTPANVLPAGVRAAA